MSRNRIPSVTWRVQEMEGNKDKFVVVRTERGKSGRIVGKPHESRDMAIKSMERLRRSYQP